MVGTRTSLKLYNTLSRKKEAFRPLKDGEVRIYVCGPTVYDVCHMGHARSYIVFDVIRRYLCHLGFSVRLVINFTDVDERITERAEARGEDPLRYADARIAEFFRDMDALGIEKADKYPRVSEYIPGMIRMVGRLLKLGFAYPLGGKIYFDVEKAGGYGALLHGSLEEAMVRDELAHGIEASRRSPLDFAIWDGTMDKDPLWQSPWGKGRIGWHVECYVMSRILGHPLDIKGGGVDLVFPHDESTRLIALALGEKLSRFYVHNAFLTFGERKMSKSRGKYITIRESLERHNPRDIRFFLLGAHYRKNLAFSERGVIQAGKSASRIEDLIRRLGEITRCSGSNDGRLLGLVEHLRKEFFSRMNDDLDTPSALQAILDFVEQVSDLSEVGLQATRPALQALGEVGSVLGFNWR